MKNIKNIQVVLLVTFCALFMSCEDYLEVETPDHKIISKTLFSSDETALSAMVGIQNQLASVFFSSGGPSSVTVLAGLSGDDLMPIYETNLPYMEFDRHEILPDNSRNLQLWSSAYNMIYMTNALLEGLADSPNVSEGVKNRLQGEARFVRAFTYFYLVNLYGDVPLVLTTDYKINAQVERNPKEEIYAQVISDLETAVSLLPAGFTTGERTQISSYAATALLARAQLFVENYQEAEEQSSRLIEEAAELKILEDLDEVFLANSEEAIWQISPQGRGFNITNTYEGSGFIIHPIFSFLAQFKLNPEFVASFVDEDQRLEDWVELHAGTGFYYAHKYKIQNSTGEILEYSMVLRLAEQYLIRAETRARQGDFAGAVADLDVLRERAGLELISNIKPGIGKDELLDLIIEERKKELFTEWGHRWLDLKRTGRAGEVFAGSSTWEETDLLYPIPESERMKNPNLTQNDGY